MADSARKTELYLRNIFLFSNLPPALLNVLHAGCKEVYAPKESVILYQDELSSDLYVVLSGEAEISLFNENGKKVVLDILKRIFF